MAFPRRFYLLFFFSVFVLLSTFLFLNRNSYPSSVPAKLGDGWSGRFGGGNPSSKGAESIGSGGAATGDIGGGDDVATPVAGKKEKDQTWADKIAANMAKAMGKSSTFEAVATIPRPSPVPRKELRVAVVESAGENEEVTAAMVYAFGRQPLSPLSLYLLEQRFQMGEIIKEFNISSPIVAEKASIDFADVVNGPTPPQLLISSSCETDLIRLSDPFETLLKAGKTYLFCVVNDADRWKEGELVDKIRPWVHQQMIDFVTLSSHTARHLRTRAIANWDFNATVTVQWLPPVFPVNLPEPPTETAQQASNTFPFALYTDADPSQNNYTDIFASVQSVFEQAKNVTNDVDTQHARNVVLHLLGRGPAPKISSSLTQNIEYNSTITFREYYTLLSHSFALMPYLPLPHFLQSRSSPAVPAALIAGVPLIANVDLLEAYSYLPPDAVWMSTTGEGEMDTVRRVVQWSAPEHWRKRQVVKKRAARIMERNVELVEEWVGIAQRKMERAGWRMKLKEGGGL